MLTKEQIRNAKDIKTKVLNIPEWGGDITIKALTFKEFTDINIGGQGPNKTTDNNALAIATFIEGVCEPKYERKEAGELQERNGSVITRIVSEIMKLSGFGIDQKNDSKATGPEETK